VSHYFMPSVSSVICLDDVYVWTENQCLFLMQEPSQKILSYTKLYSQSFQLSSDHQDYLCTYRFNGNLVFNFNVIELIWNFILFIQLPCGFTGCCCNWGYRYKCSNLWSVIWSNLVHAYWSLKESISSCDFEFCCSFL
jgi:hypothetical protein